jgi:hypothetical protein
MLRLETIHLQQVEVIQLLAQCVLRLETAIQQPLILLWLLEEVVLHPFNDLMLLVTDALLLPREQQHWEHQLQLILLGLLLEQMH